LFIGESQIIFEFQTQDESARQSFFLCIARGYGLTDQNELTETANGEE
jgi:hypothetical protein